MKKVAKFGGSSLSCASQIKKVAAIIQNNPDIKAVVVSAPGKRFAEDEKVTDLLIRLYHAQIENGKVQQALNHVLDRYRSIVEELNLPNDLITHFSQTLHRYLDTIIHPARLLDALKACGEDFNAQVISQYFIQLGLDAHYVSPLEAGIRVSDEPSNARLLESSYADIAQLNQRDGILVIPGFFGYSVNNEIVTFSRGGSDITGAIIARGLMADIYENYTDETFIYAAHPGKIASPYAIKEITYREMRELAYAGFTIFHDEALEPVYQHKIPVMIRNTNDPTVEGTKIVASRTIDPNIPVIGMSSTSKVIAITLGKYLLNREIGFTRRLFEILERHHISVEQTPSGIDTLSVIIRSDQFISEKELTNLLNDLYIELQPDSLHVEKDLTSIAIVGEGMKDSIGIANKATTALMQSHINIRMISQGASELNMVFIVPKKDAQAALECLYNAYFGHLSSTI